MKTISSVAGISLFAMVVFCASNATAGPVIIDGTDANDHGFASGGVNRDGWLYMQKALENLASTVTPSAAKVVVDLGTSSGQARASINSAFSLSSLPSQGWTLTHVEGATSITSWLDRMSTANTGILYIPTYGNTSGDLSASELGAINAKAPQLNNYVSGFGNRPQGGALFSMAESGPGANGWLNTLLPGASVTDRGSGGIGTPITLTPAGSAAFPGLTSADTARAVPWHNYFSGDLGGLQVLGTAPEGANTRNLILGGGAGTVINPGPIIGDQTTRLKTVAVDFNGRGNIDSSKPTIVLTHGWEPTGTFDPNVSPFASQDGTGLLAAAQNRLCNSNACSANIFTAQWENAYTGVLGVYNARAFTNAVGTELAEQLEAKLGHDYSNSIQLVGHSLGTLVNSSAAAVLNLIDAFPNKKFDVEQLTFLDPPLRAPLPFLPPVNADDYYKLLPKGTVQYVDNFFSLLPAVPLPLIGGGFGLPIFGAAPNGGEGTLADHSGVHSSFYSDRVLDKNGTWITALLPDRYANRPGPTEWTGESLLTATLRVTTEFAQDAWRAVVNTAKAVTEFAFEVGKKTYRFIVDAANTVIDKTVGIVNATVDLVSKTATAVIDTGAGLITATTDKLKSWMHIKESSPVMVAHDITVPSGTELLSFTFDFLNPGDGDWLTVHFNEQLLWSFLGTDFVGEVMTATIPLSELAGHQGTLYLTLNNVGQSNAEVLISDLVFEGQASNVTEPGSLFLLLFGLILLLALEFLRHEREDQWHALRAYVASVRSWR